MVSLRDYFVLVSVIAMFHIVSSVPTATVVCSENGFKPSFTNPYVAIKTIGWEVKIGTGCSKTKPLIAAGDGTDTMDVTDFNADGTDTDIVYKTGANVACGGTFDNSADNSTIDYTNVVEITVTETLRDTVKRIVRYEFNLKCNLTRSIDALSSAGNWTISSTLAATDGVDDVADEIEFPTSLKFYTTTERTIEQSATFELAMGDDLFIRVEEDTDNTLFKFVVKNCWSTPHSNPSHATKDDFFVDMCAKDDTMTVVDKTAASKDFDMNIKAFFFTVDHDAQIYVHCELFICKQDDTSSACVQKTKAVCNAGRKRRSIGDGVIEQRTITSRQRIVFDDTEIFVPTCAEGYVYDREKKECSNQHLVEIKGIYLDIPWNPSYANTTSEAFKNFAREKAYQLYSLLQATEEGRNIEGVKVVGAKQGSVVLDVQIKYADKLNASTAFQHFEKAIRSTTPTSSRVVNILSIRQDKSIIEYLPIIAEPETDIGKMMLIVLVVVLLAVIFISGITFYKVKQLRRRLPPSDGNVKGFDNTAMDNMS